MATCTWHHIILGRPRVISPEQLLPVVLLLTVDQSHPSALVRRTQPHQHNCRNHTHLRQVYLCPPLELLATTISDQCLPTQSRQAGGLFHTLLIAHSTYGTRSELFSLVPTYPDIQTQPGGLNYESQVTFVRSFKLHLLLNNQ